MDFVQPFLVGMISGCTATSIIQPIDMVKVRLQLKNEEIGILKSQGKIIPNEKVAFGPMVKTIFQENGIQGFYKGLSSALMRQVFYATTKLGLYKVLSDNHKKKYKSTLMTISLLSLLFIFLIQ